MLSTVVSSIFGGKKNHKPPENADQAAQQFAAIFGRGAVRG